jgi:hypothetical protein
MSFQTGREASSSVLEISLEEVVLPGLEPASRRFPHWQQSSARGRILSSPALALSSMWTDAIPRQGCPSTAAAPRRAGYGDYMAILRCVSHVDRINMGDTPAPLRLPTLPSSRLSAVGRATPEYLACGAAVEGGGDLYPLFGTTKGWPRKALLLRALPKCHWEVCFKALADGDARPPCALRGRGPAIRILWRDSCFVIAGERAVQCGIAPRRDRE